MATSEDQPQAIVFNPFIIRHVIRFGIRIKPFRQFPQRRIKSRPPPHRIDGFEPPR